MGYTINDIARMTGLSRATVSRVINNSSHVRPETRKIVQDAIDELGYVPNMIARGLRTETQIVGVVTQDILNPYYIEALYEIEKLCKAHGYALLHMNSDNDPAIEKQNLYQLLSMQVQGVVMLANMNDASDSMIRRCRDSTHMITMEGRIEGVDCVLSDPRQGVADLVDHLVELGHRQFGLAHRALRSFPIRERENVFRERLRTHGIEIKKEHVFFGDDYIRQIQQAWEKKLLPTVLFTLNDSTAFHVYRWAKDVGVDIPMDLSIAGFDNISTSGMMMPSLSTVEQPIGRLAEIATQMLIEKIEKKGPRRGERSQLINIGTHFIQRDSTAPPAH